MKPKISRINGLTIVFTTCFGIHTNAQTFDPTKDGGTWGNASNWIPASVPNQIGAEAVINGAGPSSVLPATAALDVLLDGNYTVGRLSRTSDGSQSATFSTTPTTNDPTKGLTLATSTGIPTINTVGNTFFYSALFGNQGFEKTGAGRFTLRFNQIDHTYVGQIRISEGTLGIEKNSSLGNANNGLTISGGARLFAEPGANTGTITLPASRTITLDGLGAQIGSSPAIVNLNIEGDIVEDSEGSGLSKSDAGLVTLLGTNSWTGSLVVNAGILSAAKTASLPNYESQTVSVFGTSTLAVRFGNATSSWSTQEIAGLLGNALFSETAYFGLDTTANTADATYSEDLINSFAINNFNKIGAGKLTLTNSPDLARIIVHGGTLALGSASLPSASLALSFTANNNTLDLGGLSASAASFTHFNGGTTTLTNGSLSALTQTLTATAANTVLALPAASLTLARVIPFGGNTTTINGTNGSLTVNGDFNFEVNSTQNTRVVMSGLSSFTYNRSNRAFRCLPVTASTDTTLHELVLANGTNTVTANLVQVGGASGTSQGNAHQGQMRLGTTNDFRTPTFQVGGFNGSGVVTYQASLTNPSFKLRGADGVAPATSLIVGETSSGIRSGAGTLDLSSGSADILADSIQVGRHIANATNATTSAMTIPSGTVSATTLTLVRKQGSGSPAAIGNFTQTGGNVNIDDLLMVETVDGIAPNTASSTQNLQANYNLNGGTLTARDIKQGVLATPITAGNTQRNLTLRGGTLTNKSAGDLLISGITVTVAGNTNTVVNSTPGQKVRLAADATYSARINSTARTSGALSVTGHLDLSSSPALSIFDDATTNASELEPGTKLVLINYSLGSLTGTFSGIADGGSVNITKGTVTNSFVIDYNDPEYGGKAVTLTIPGGVNTPPTISDLADQSIPSGSNTGILSFTLSDEDASSLVVTGNSSNTSLVPNSNIVFNGSGANRSVTVTPLSGLSGSATITVTVTDNGGLTAEDSFIITVTDNYLSWATANGVTGGPEGDADNDGVRNLVEYALANGGERGVLSGNTITFTKRGAPYGNDVTYEIESSTLLTAESWTTLAKPPVVENADSISYTFTPGSPSKQFARLKVMRLP
jgi:autotransporter-associated beta strand protein